MCYTYPVSRNLTLAIDDNLLLRARRVALERRTTVNQLVREYLDGLVRGDSRRQLARERLGKAFAEGIVDVGVVDWNRDDLHER